VDCVSREYGARIAILEGRAATAPSVTPSPSAQASPVDTLEVKLIRKNGVLVVPVVINDRITLDFIVDSGASDVAITADVAMTLIRTGTIGRDDFLGRGNYVLADGSTVSSHRFLIRSLKVGDCTLENVAASISSPEGDLLLGQSFLSQFRSWSIDNERQVLVLRR
jgi:clan AA aspartic protease (TIGR02281 family)